MESRGCVAVLLIEHTTHHRQRWLLKALRIRTKSAATIEGNVDKSPHPITDYRKMVRTSEAFSYYGVAMAKEC
jgi:hypothetical protein